MSAITERERHIMGQLGMLVRWQPDNAAEAERLRRELRVLKARRKLDEAAAALASAVEVEH